MERTPRTWPEAVEPTPQQLADWLKVCTDDERLDHATRVIDSGRRASACLMEDHAGLKDEVAFLRRRIPEIRVEWMAEPFDAAGMARND